MWGHSMLVLGALCSFLEPFCGHLSPKIDKVSEELTFEIPPRRALGGFTRRIRTLLSHTMHRADGLRKSTPPQNRQLNFSISNSKYEVDDFVGELTFENQLLKILCGISSSLFHAASFQGIFGPSALEATQG